MGRVKLQVQRRRARIWLVDTLRLKEMFTTFAGGKPPTRTYVIGTSMGGGVTLLAAHLIPTTFAGHLAMCPVVTPERWDFAVSVAFAAEAISGVPLRATPTDTDIARMRDLLGTAAKYTEADFGKPLIKKWLLRLDSRQARRTPCDA